MSFPSEYAREPSRRGTRDAERTRAAVLKAARRQIAEVGFHKMAISAVAREAGVSQSGMLHHFPSKAALLAAVLDEREHDDEEFLFGDDATPLGWDAFDALVSLAARNANRPQWVQMFVRVAAEATDPAHPGHEWILEHYRSMRSWLTDAVRAGIEDGTFRADVPVALLVESTVAVLDGLQQQWVLEPDAVSMVDATREHVRMLKQAWAPAA